MSLAEIISFFADVLPDIFIFIVLLAVVHKLDDLATKFVRITKRG